MSRAYIHLSGFVLTIRLLHRRGCPPEVSAGGRGTSSGRRIRLKCSPPRICREECVLKNLLSRMWTRASLTAVPGLMQRRSGRDVLCFHSRLEQPRPTERSPHEAVWPGRFLRPLMGCRCLHPCWTKAPSAWRYRLQNPDSSTARCSVGCGRFRSAPIPAFIRCTMHGHRCCPVLEHPRQ